MQMINKSMVGIVKALDKALQSNNLDRVAATMEQFEKQFENLDVQTGCVEDAMNQQATLSTPEEDVNLLLQQVCSRLYYAYPAFVFSASAACSSPLALSLLLRDHPWSATMPTSWASGNLVYFLARSQTSTVWNSNWGCLKLVHRLLHPQQPRPLPSQTLQHDSHSCGTSDLQYISWVGGIRVEKYLVHVRVLEHNHAPV
jgi:hypothetical protein